MLDLLKLKYFAEMRFFCGRVENRQGKSKNARSNPSNFSLYSNLSTSGHEPFPKQALVFTWLQYKSFENTVGIGEIACNKQFLLFPQYFLPV